MMLGTIDYTQTAFWVVVLIVLAVAARHALRRFRSESRAEQEQAQREQVEFERLRDSGALLPDGNLKCIVCERAPATRRWMATRKSDLDRDFLGHRKLHHHLPMYVVGDSVDPTPQVCESCRRMVEGKLEEVLSDGRSAAAKLKNDHERDLAHWENGGLLHWGQSEATKSYRSRVQIQQAPMLLALPAADTPVHHSGSVTLPPASKPEIEEGS
jgi:hypothetical protein